MMEKQYTIATDVSQAALSREELEQHLRARAWKDDAFRQELLANPKAVLQRDFAAWFPEGKIPSGLTIKVVEEDEQSICFVLLPKAPDVLPDTEELEEHELSATSGGGVTDNGTCWSCNTCYMCTRLICTTKTYCQSVRAIRL